MFPKFQKNFAKDGGGGGSGGQKLSSYSSKSDATVEVESRTDVRYVIAIVIFVVSVLEVGLAYGANFYFDRELVAIDEQLIQQDETLKTNVITTLVSFDQSIALFSKAGKSRLGYVPIMEEINKLVVPGVHFTAATISLEGEQTYRISINGTANSLVSYLQQVNTIISSEDAFRVTIDSYTIRNEVDGNSTVTFSLSTSVPVGFFQTSPEVSES